MSSGLEITKVVGQAASLKAEIRLVGAITAFAQALDVEQRSQFMALKSRPPSAHDFLQLTRQLSDDGARRHRAWKPYGTRLLRFLEGVQLMSKVGDICVGGAQNLVASGVWASVRLSLQVVVGYLSFFEKVSEVFMKLGGMAAIQQDLVALYPNCTELHNFMCEYLVVVVNFCQRMVTISNKSSAISQFTAAVWASFSNELQSFDTNISMWSSLIDHMVNRLNTETNLTTSRGVERANQILQIWSSRDKQSLQKELAELKSRLLASLCPQQREFEGYWLRERRKGDSNWIKQNAEFKKWLGSASSSTLWVTGSMGSGKTVLMANMVYHVTECEQEAKPPSVAYFFCRSKKKHTLHPRNIAGSLMHQFVKNLDIGPDKDAFLSIQKLFPDGFEATDATTVMDWALKILPDDGRYTVILDALDEVSLPDARIILTTLRRFSQARHVKICCSTRYTKAVSQVMELSSGYFPSQAIISMKSAAKDGEIQSYIDREIDNRKHLTALSKEQLQILKDALIVGAQGMYLWVALQIETILPWESGICITSSDLSNILSNLPKNLPELFEKALSNIQDKRYGSKLFEIVAAARRPITIEELRIALNVEPGNPTWNAATLPIDKTNLIVRCAGPLFEVDEQGGAVDFIHYSVLEYLTSPAARKSPFAFTVKASDHTLAGICITYLQYEVHDRRLVRAPQALLTTSENIATKVLSPLSNDRSLTSSATSTLAKAFVRRRHNPQTIDINRLFERLRETATSIDDVLVFADYATQHWLGHTALLVFDPDDPTFKLFQRLVNAPPVFLEVPWADSSALYWSTQNHHFGVFQADSRCLPQSGFCLPQPGFGPTRLDPTWLGQHPDASSAFLSQFGHTSTFSEASLRIIKLLGRNLTKMTKRTRELLDDYLATPTNWTNSSPELKALLALITRGAPLEPGGDSPNRSLLEYPLAVALLGGWADGVLLLVKLGASVIFTAKSSPSDVIDMFETRGATIPLIFLESKPQHMSPLQLALYLNDIISVQILLNAGADASQILKQSKSEKEYMLRRQRPSDTSWETDYALHWSIQTSRSDITHLLLDHSAKPGKGLQGQTTLGLCIEALDLELCTWMLAHGEDPNELHRIRAEQRPVEDVCEIHPLTMAIERGSKDIVDLLLRCGAKINIHVTNRAPLPVAVIKAPALVDRLIRAGAALDGVAYHQTSLVAAISTSSVPLVDRFLKSGANPNDTQGATTALIAAVRTGKSIIVEKLLASGAQPISHMGRSPLGSAVELDDHKGASLLLDAGADVEEHFLFMGWRRFRPLQAAVHRKKHAMVQLLITYGANTRYPITSVSPMESNPLMLAVSEARVADIVSLLIVKALVAAGAEVILAGRAANEQPLLLAIQTGKMKLANALLDKIEKKNLSSTPDAVLRIAFHLVFDANYTVDSGIVLDSLSNLLDFSQLELNRLLVGETSLTRANVRKITWLLDHGADPNWNSAKHRDNSAMPLHVALRSKQEAVVAALIKAGAFIGDVFEPSQPYLQQALRKNSSSLAMALLTYDGKTYRRDRQLGVNNDKLAGYDPSALEYKCVRLLAAPSEAATAYQYFLTALKELDEDVGLRFLDLGLDVLKIPPAGLNCSNGADVTAKVAAVRGHYRIALRVLRFCSLEVCVGVLCDTVELVKQEADNPDDGMAIISTLIQRLNSEQAGSKLDWRKHADWKGAMRGGSDHLAMAIVRGLCNHVEMTGGTAEDNPILFAISLRSLSAFCILWDNIVSISPNSQVIRDLVVKNLRTALDEMSSFGEEWRTLRRMGLYVGTSLLDRDEY